MEDYNPLEVWERAKKRLATLTKEEKFQTLVDAGVFKQDGSPSDLWHKDLWMRNVDYSRTPKPEAEPVEN